MNKNLPTLEQVFDTFDALYKIIDLMDGTYRIYNGNYVMKYYQNRGITLRDIFTQDMLNWLCFLGWQDGNIDANEVLFINDLLNLNLTQLDVLDIVKSLNRDILTTLPTSFAIFIEYNAVSGSKQDIDIIEVLFSSFAVSGTYFIACDGNIDDNELIGLDGYLKTLDMNIRTFDIKNLHEYMLDNI